MKNLRLVAFVVVVPALVACPDIVIPPDAIVACGADGACPAGSSCDDTIDRCVPDDVADKDAPVVTGFTVDPRNGGVGTTFTLSFVVDEALGADPVVTVFGDTVVKADGGDRADPETPWTYSFTVDGTEPAGDQSVDVVVVDVFGNRATRNFADVFSVDFAAPTITDPGLDPVIGDPELSFTVRLQGAERLTVTGDIEDDKDLVVTGPSDQVSVDVDVVFTAGDGRKQLRLEAFDDVGNSAALNLEVTLDSSVPFSRPTITARAGQTAVKNADVVDVGGNVTPGSTAVDVRLVDEDGDDIATVSGVLVDNVTGALSGSVDMGGLGTASEVRLVVIVVKGAVASIENQSRSNALVVDNAPPANPSCSLPARSTSTNVALALDADDFVDVEVTGDVVDARPFLPLAGSSVNLILSGGEGTKTLTANFRDGAHNITPCVATTTLDVSAPVLTNVFLSPPAGQTAVRSNQTVQLSATVDVAGASVVSARLLDQQLNFIDDIPGVTVTGSAVSGAFDVDDLVSGAGVTGLVVELVVAEGGLQSLPVRSPQLNIDDDPPTDPVVTGPSDSASFFVDLDVGGCAGALTVNVSGDLANDDGSFVDLPGDGVITVILSAGIGDKDLVVVCRDGAFNVSGPDTITINLSTDDVLSLPTLSAPAGQTAIKNGDTLTIGGNGESGATVTGVRLVNVANGNTVQTLANNVVVLTGTTLSGSFTAAGLVNGQNVALEVLLSARARTSVAADSRSGALAVDLAVPVAPVAGSLRLVETTLAANDPARLNEAVDNGLAVTALAGAIVDATFAELCADAACNTVIGAPVVVDGAGAFATVALAHRANHDVFVRGVDGAKNRGTTTRVVVPRITFTSVLPAVANVDDNVVISFSTNVAVNLPTVVVDGNAATLQTQTGNNFVFTYNTLGNEGDGTVVVRVTAEDDTVFAAGTTGTDATTTVLDFTAPTIDAAKITLAQNDPGTADNVTAVAAAVLDALDAAVDVEVKGDGNVVANRVTSADGSFTAVTLGDNLVDVVLLTATDEAGNTRTLTLNNDRRAPVLSQLTATARARDNDVVTVSFRSADAASALRADPVVTVGGRAATRISGNRALLNEVYVYEFTVDDGLDDEGDNNVAVSVVDVRGNGATAATSAEFDFTPPSLRNTNPGDKLVWNLAPKAFGSVVDDGSGLAASGTVDVRHCDTLSPCTGSVVFTGGATNVGRDWSATIPTAGFVDGDDYEMTITWADQVGNVATVVRDFEFDDAPTAQPTDLEAVDVDGVVLLAWTAPTTVAPISYLIHYDDTVIGVPPYAGTGATEGASPVEVDGAEVVFEINGLPPGDHVFAITGVDASSNESAYSNEVLVTVTAP